MFAAIALAAGLGILGQGLRAGLGLKKLYDNAPSSFEYNFSLVYLVITLILGSVCGVLMWIIAPASAPLAFVIAGYGGTAFIESTVATFGPK